MPKLKDVFGVYTGKELRLLERKNGELTKEFNRLFDETRSKKKVLDALYMREYAMNGPDPNVEIGMKQELSDSLAKMSGIERQKVKSIEKKIRHERIIDICELNSIQNEQWIRGLNFYLSNMRKMIKKEKFEISVLEKDIETLTGMNEDFVRSHNSNVDSHSLVIQSIKSHLDRQVRIDAQIGNTNELIFKSIEIKRNKHYESLAKDREREELEARQIFEHKKRKQVEHELGLVSKKFEQVKDIFEKCPTTNVDWEQKTEFTVMLSNLETLRDLERYSVELDIKGADLRESNAKLRLRLAVSPLFPNPKQTLDSVEKQRTYLLGSRVDLPTNPQSEAEAEPSPTETVPGYEQKILDLKLASQELDTKIDTASILQNFFPLTTIEHHDLIRSAKVITQDHFTNVFLKNIFGYNVDRTEICKIEAVSFFFF